MAAQRIIAERVVQNRRYTVFFCIYGMPDGIGITYRTSGIKISHTFGGIYIKSLQNR